MMFIESESDVINRTKPITSREELFFIKQISRRSELNMLHWYAFQNYKFALENGCNGLKIMSDPDKAIDVLRKAEILYPANSPFAEIKCAGNTRVAAIREVWLPNNTWRTAERLLMLADEKLYKQYRQKKLGFED